MNLKNLKLTTLLLLGIGLTSLHAQEAIPTTGGNASGSGGTASYSIGQIVYTTYNATDGSVAQGVQQPYEFFTNSVNENKFIILKMTVYPNPTLASVSLRIDHLNPENFSFQLYDMGGKLLCKQNISSTETSIPMENLTASIYYLKIVQTEHAPSPQIFKTFKIIKN